MVRWEGWSVLQGMEKGGSKKHIERVKSTKVFSVSWVTKLLSLAKV